MKTVKEKETKSLVDTFNSLKLKDVHFIKDLKKVYIKNSNIEIRDNIGIDYYLYHLEKHGRITVALFEVEGKYILGYSICGEGDNFSKKTGQAMARTRAMERMNLKTPAERMLPTKEDLNKIPSHLRKIFTKICYDFYNKYELLGEDNE